MKYIFVTGGVVRTTLDPRYIGLLGAGKGLIVTTGIIHVIPSVCCGFVGYSLR